MGKAASAGAGITVVVYRPAFSGPGRLEQVAVEPPVRIGRLDAADPATRPDLSLDHDFTVSRSHAQLRRQDSQWLIEDLGSKHGTLVNGKEIKGAGPVEFTLGTPVRTGETTWMALPRQWLLVPSGEVLVFGPCATTVNYATYHCGTPLVGPLTAWNFGETAAPPLKLRLELEQYSDPCLVSVPALGPGGRDSLGVPLLRLYPERLRRQDSPQKSTLCLTVDGKSRPDLARELLVLGLWDWSFDPTARATLAALVTPHDPAVERTVAGARVELDLLAPGETVESLLRSGRDDAERLCLEALYRFLANCGIVYVAPRVHESPETACCYQKVRSAEQVLPGGSAPGAATCLDLAVFFAGCLERIGLAPLIFLLGESADRIAHAFVGCWVGPSPGPRAVREDAALLRREVATGQIVALETTAVARGFGRAAPGMSFPEAVAEAGKLLREAPWVCAVDVNALRPPRGRITPLQYPFAPVVASAVSTARELARSRHRENVELAHLFCGFLAAGGEVAEEVLPQAGHQRAALASRLRALVSDRGFQGEPAPTANYAACLRVAGDLAWQAGASLVREQDLLWAILLCANGSNAFLALCKQLQLDLDKMDLILQRIHLRPQLGASYYDRLSEEPFA